LKKQIAEIQATNHLNELILVKADNERLQVENLKLIKKYNTLQGATSTPHTNQVTELLANYTLPPPPTPVALLKPNAVLSTFKKNIRNKQGTYTIDGLDYQKNEGTRQEVWDGIAYQTSGLLKKHDLILNKNGKLISKKKCIAAAVQNHLETYNASR
jgi:hypothetical protein